MPVQARERMNQHKHSSWNLERKLREDLRITKQDITGKQESQIQSCPNFAQDNRGITQSQFAITVTKLAISRPFARTGSNRELPLPNLGRRELLEAGKAKPHGRSSPPGKTNKGPDRTVSDRTTGRANKNTRRTRLPRLTKDTGRISTNSRTQITRRPRKKR
jgi:hypothetical protein